MQGLAQSIAIMTDDQRATQASLDALIAARSLARPNPLNPNLVNRIAKNQTPSTAPIAPPNAHQHAPPPHMAPANINPLPPRSCSCLVTSKTKPALPILHSPFLSPMGLTLIKTPTA